MRSGHSTISSRQNEGYAYFENSWMYYRSRLLQFFNLDVNHPNIVNKCCNLVEKLFKVEIKYALFIKSAQRFQSVKSCDTLNRDCSSTVEGKALRTNLEKFCYKFASNNK